MRARCSIALLGFSISACGGAVPATVATTPAADPAEAPPAEQAVRAPAPAPHHLSNALVRCLGDAPEPEGPTIAGAGTSVRVRARSIAFELEDEGLVVCEAQSAPSGQLVLLLDPWVGLGVGVFDGEAVGARDGLQLGEPDDEEEDEDDGEDDGEDVGRIVRLAGAAEVTAVRSVQYCPDGNGECAIAGPREAVEAYVDHDPTAPRSGWDLTTSTLRAGRLRRARTRWLDERVCGLEIGLRGEPADLSCAGSPAEVALCLLGEASEGSVSEEEVAAFFVVIADGQRELVVPALDVTSLACVDGLLLFGQQHVEFTSQRGFGVVEQRAGRIVRGQTMRIRDHAEGMSDCANAWDGVELVPVLRGGAVVGGLVMGAGGRPFFDLVRGDLGDVQTPAFWPGHDGEAPRAVNEQVFAYGHEPIPLALRETPEGFLAIAAPDPAPVCRLEVNDADGQTNLRPDPSTRRPAVGTVPNGTRIDPVEQRGRWYRVESPAPGWVFATSLRRRCD